MRFELEGDDGIDEVDVEIQRLLIAGFTARDRSAVLAHLNEVKELGVEMPERLPALYPSIASRLTQARSIQVPTPATSGEAEVVFIQTDETLLVTLGSDHTERSSEGVALIPSKSVCDKPIARRVWDVTHVSEHIESLELTCEVLDGGEWRAYQRGAVDHFLPLAELLGEVRARAGWSAGDVLMCGTLPTIGGLAYADEYRMRLTDRRLSREINLEYAVELVAVDSLL